MCGIDLFDAEISVEGAFPAESRKSTKKSGGKPEKGNKFCGKVEWRSGESRKTEKKAMESRKTIKYSTESRKVTPNNPSSV